MTENDVDATFLRQRGCFEICPIRRSIRSCHLLPFQYASGLAQENSAGHIPFFIAIWCHHFVQDLCNCKPSAIFLDLSNQLISTSIDLSSKKHTSHVESTFATVPGHLIRIVPEIHQYRQGLLPLSHSCHGTDNTAVTHHITLHSMIPWLL